MIFISESILNFKHYFAYLSDEPVASAERQEVLQRLAQSSLDLASRFSTFPTASIYIPLVKEEIQEVKNELKQLPVSVARLSEEMTDVLVTALNLMAALGGSVEDFNQAICELTSSSEGDPFQLVWQFAEQKIQQIRVSASLFTYIPDARAYLELLYSSVHHEPVAIVPLARRTVHALAHVMMVIRAGGGEYQDMVEAVDKVIDKNNAKSLQTHQVNPVTGKISRKETRD